MSSQAQVELIYLELQANIAKYRAAMHEATALSNQFKHSSVSNTQAASAAIRLFEGDMTNMVRAAERFIGQSQVLSGVLRTAFPVIGAVAIASVIGEGIKRVTEFIEKARQVPRALQDAFQSSNLSVTETNDQLQKSNDELANQILKLEGKPQNNLALAIDETRLKADALAKSLAEDSKQVQELLKNQSIGFFSGLVTGQMPTGHTADVVNSWAAELKRRANNVVLAQHEYGVGSQQDKAAQAALEQSQKDAETAVKKRIDELQAQLKAQTTPQVSFAVSPTGGVIQQGSPVAPGGPDIAANLNIAQGYLAQLYGRDNEAVLQQTNTQEKAKADALQHAKDLAAAQKSAQELLLRQDDASLEELKHQKAMWSQTWSPRDDEAFWESHISAFQKGSEQFDTVRKRIFADEEEASKQLQNAYKALLASQTQAARMDAVYAQDQAKAADAGADKLAQAAAHTQVTQARIRAEMALAEAKLRAGSGQISPLGLAQAETAAHVADYREQLQALQQELADLHKNDFGSLSGENTAKEMAVQLQINEAESKAYIQAMEDAQNEFATTWKGSIQSIYDTVIKSAQDTAQKVSQITTQFIGGMNDVLANALTERHTAGWTRDFRNSVSEQFRSGAEGLAKTSLEKIEGGVLGGLGLGKRDGSSASKALYVQMAGGADSNLSGLPDFSKLGSGYPAILGPNGETTVSRGLLGMLNDSNFFSSLFGGKLFGSGSLFGGGFASGGDVWAGVPIDVGELGPERFVPYTNGRIIPHNQLTNNAPTIHIDARGSTDPAAVEAAVHRAMRSYGPQTVAAAAAAQKDMAARRPSSAR